MTNAASRDGQADPGATGAPPSPVTIVAHHVGSVGGMERQITDLIMGLRALGHEVTVIAYACELPPGAGVDFWRVRGPDRPLLLGHPWFMLAGSLLLRRRRRGLVQATGAIVLGRVDVISVHYCHQVGPTNPSRSSLLFRANARANAALGMLAERLCFPLDRPRRLVCVSEGVAEEVREHFPRQAARVITIPNGVDVRRFAPGTRTADARAARAQIGVGDDRMVAVFVGGEWARKGLRPAIEALRGAPRWDLIVVGSGDREHYERLAERAGVADAVHWLGVSRDVAPLYELADALVFPSSYEAFPIVALEAAASGLPILATPVSGVRELVQDGVSGFLIDADAQVIAARLEELAGDPALRERLGREARRAALAFSSEQMVREHHRLYQALAGDSRAAASQRD